MSKTNYKSLPLIYSCSGSSNIAQLANQVALEFDFEELAEMSCIAGIGGNVKAKVKLAQSGRKIIALDGCPLNCVKNCLKTQNLNADFHITLSEHGIKKQYHKAFSPEDVPRIKTLIIENLES